MRRSKIQSIGFWISYIDFFAAFSAIIIVLFSVSYIENIILKQSILINNRKMVDFSNAWSKVEDQLINAGAEPIKDINWGGYRINIAERVLFPINSSDLTTEGVDNLTLICSIINDFVNEPTIKKSVRIVIGGHTDKSGGDFINIPLSVARAKSVELVMKRIIGDDIYIETVGYGSQYLQENYKNNPFSAKHRRISITIQPIAVECLK